MKFYVIASSSKGNVSYLETGNKKILIDAGISYTKIKKALKDIGVNIKHVTDIFITHEHSDHVKGLKVLMRYISPKLHMSLGTKEALQLSDDEVNVIGAFEEFIIEDLNVLPLPLSHDAREPLGFLFSNAKSKIVYITDTGYLSKGVLERIENATLYYLETNHDPYLLTNSTRPYYLINRILNEKGHLSNYDAAYYFSKLIGKETTYLIHAHVSEECNTSEHIEKTYIEVLKAQKVDFSNVTFIEAKPDEPLEVIEL